MWAVVKDVATPGIPWAAVSTMGAIYLTTGEGPEDDRYLRRYIPGRGFDESSAFQNPLSLEVKATTNIYAYQQSSLGKELINDLDILTAASTIL